ncbi:hypothetical protein FRC00_004702 [Tulasnella sp. 408]|nr:hypothetical protein FRC00_004702 [Tulasnella sp. 408]
MKGNEDASKPSYPDANQKNFRRGDVDDVILALSGLLGERPPRLCPRLNRLRLACASYEHVRELVLLRPALEFVSVQYRKPGDDVVQSKAIWREKVDVIRWIRSKVEFELERTEVAVGPGMEEEEGVLWDPTALPKSKKKRTKVDWSSLGVETEGGAGAGDLEGADDRASQEGADEEGGDNVEEMEDYEEEADDNDYEMNYFDNGEDDNDDLGDGGGDPDGGGGDEYD